MLNVLKRVMMWLCILPPDESSSKRMKIAYVFFGALVFSSLFIIQFSYYAFFLKFISIDKVESFYVLFCGIGSSGTVYVFVIAYHKRDKITALFEKISKIHESSKLY